MVRSHLGAETADAVQQTPARRMHELRQALAGASLGQMLRGGRSWPSDRNVRTGVESSGKDAGAGSRTENSAGRLLTNEVTEQNAEHTLHLSGVLAWSWCPLAPWSWPA